MLDEEIMDLLTDIENEILPELSRVELEEFYEELKELYERYSK